jgi:phosphonatase-like hydrolase
MFISRRSSLAALAAAATSPIAAQAQPAQSDDDDDDKMPKAKIKLIALDIGGTLIQDHGEVPAALMGAFSRHGLTVTPAEISVWRGASKRSLIQHFVELRGPAAGGPALTDAVFADFVAHASKAYENVQPIAGAVDALKTLKTRGYVLATTTGFDRQLDDQIMRHLGWHGYFVANITSDDVVDGRPSPFMLFHAMEAARIDDVTTVMAVGDTPLDLQAANNAGVGAAIGVYSGAATEDRLRRERSTGILPSVASLPALLEKGLPITQWRCR